MSKSIVESIARQSATGKQVYTVQGSDGVTREIDQRDPADRQYILECIAIARSQMNAGTYYGRLKGGDLRSLTDYMENYDAIEENES